MRRSVAFVALFLVNLSGCEPTPPRPAELGRIIYDPAQVPGMDHPYRLPEAETRPPGDEKPAQGEKAADGDQKPADGEK